MDQLDLAVARQMAAERQSLVIRAAEQRRMLSERASAQPAPLDPTRVSVPTVARPSLRAWLTGHARLAMHLPATH